VRRLIGPVTLQDMADVPDWIPWTAPIKTDGLLDGIWSNWMASPTGSRDTYEAGHGETYELPLKGTVRTAA
jgi:hypothetical protein